MKRKIIIIALLLIVVIPIIKAQTNNEEHSHLKFRGISITGKLPAMIRQLQNKGYSLEDRENNSARLNGTFANERCDILISTSPISSEVYLIMVVFEKSSSWYSLKADYRRIKEQLQEKYGIEPSSIERFKSPYYEGDGYELTATSVGKCTYFSKYELDKGCIILAIADKQLIIYYEDKLGASINEQEENENSINDL